MRGHILTLNIFEWMNLLEDYFANFNIQMFTEPYFLICDLHRAAPYNEGAGGSLKALGMFCSHHAFFRQHTSNAGW